MGRPKNSDPICDDSRYCSFLPPTEPLHGNCYSYHQPAEMANEPNPCLLDESCRCNQANEMSVTSKKTIDY